MEEYQPLGQSKASAKANGSGIEINQQDVSMTDAIDDKDLTPEEIASSITVNLLDIVAPVEDASAELTELPELWDGQLAYRRPQSAEWLPLTDESFKIFNDLSSLEEHHREKIRSYKSNLSELLSSSLQLPNLGFFAGSGTSLAEVKGPSMWGLWKESMGFDMKAKSISMAAEAVCNTVKYSERDNPNIEHFLSQCDAYLSFQYDKDVNDFVLDVKRVILERCSTFLDESDSDISSYTGLLQKLARRRVRDPRLRVFTTNYDMCFETAASELGMMVVDGLSYTRKRRFDGQYFNFDIVRRDSENHEFVEGIFQLYKLHGSVSWQREQGDVFEYLKPSAEDACLIYPAKGKYQQAFLQPHLELLSRFLEFLRQPNSCLIMAGFGFNDDHLSEPIYSSIKSNPSLKLIITDFKCARHIGHSGSFGSSNYWQKFSELALRGYDIHFVNGSFRDFVDKIPHLKALSPAEQLVNAVKRAGAGR